MCTIQTFHNMNLQGAFCNCIQCEQDKCTYGIKSNHIFNAHSLAGFATHTYRIEGVKHGDLGIFLCNVWSHDIEHQVIFFLWKNGLDMLFERGAMHPLTKCDFQSIIRRWIDTDINTTPLVCIATYQGVKHRARLISTGIRCGAPTVRNPISLLARFRRRTFGVHSRPRVAPGRVNAIYKFMKCIGMDSQSKRRCAFPCTALVGSRPVFFFIGACRCRLSVHKFAAEVCSSMWC